MMGFALDPDYDTNGFIYLLYVVDRHHLLYFGTPSYSSTTDEYWNATIGRVTKYKVVKNAQNQTVADPTTRKILLGEKKSNGIPLLYNSHGLGSLVFADDKTLLISAGDAASYAMDDFGPNADTYFAQALTDSIIRPNENVGAFRAQMVNSYNGKILRIDKETGDGIPSNPFYQSSAPRSAQSRVWAMGFRNPFRFVVRPNTGSTLPSAGDVGEIYVGDVGYGRFEELNTIRYPGANCGWPIYEGITPTSGDYYTQSFNIFNKDELNPLYGVNGCTRQYFTFAELLKQATADNNTTVYNPCDPTKPITGSIGNRYFHRVPALDWAHYYDSARVRVFNGNNAAVAQIGTTASGVTGVPFRGSSVTAGCWYTGNLFPPNYKNTYLVGDYVGNWIKDIVFESYNQIRSVTDLATNITGFINLVENPLDGSLFAVDYGSNLIRRIGFGGNIPPVVKIASDKNYGPGPLAVQFNGSSSYDPEGGQLTYSWDFGDGTTSTSANPAKTFTWGTNTPKMFVVKLSVKDPANNISTDSILISLNNTPPAVNIISPVKNSSYAVGSDTTYKLQAQVTDAEHISSQLSYKWQVFLRHNTHEHAEPIDTNRITSATINRLGCNGDTYYWFFKLTVTDAAGLSTVDSSKIFPACATAPPVIQTQPQAQTICFNQQAVFSSTVSDLYITRIQWQESANKGSTWTDIPDAFSSTYTFTPRLQDSSKLYRVAWTNSIGTTYSNSALLTVKSIPPAPDGPLQQSFCFAATVADLSVTGSSIHWYTGSPGGRPLTTSTPLSSGVHYYATQTINGCESGNTLDVTVNISSSSFTGVTLDGSGSKGNISNYKWSYLSGPSVPEIRNDTSAIATALNLIKGVYTFSLSLNNGQSTSKVLVNVNPSDSDLYVHAGFDRTIALPNSSVQLDGSGSSGHIVSYNWSYVSGPVSPIIQNPALVSTMVSGLLEGTYAFQLTVKDEQNRVMRDTVQVVVLPPSKDGVSPVILATNTQNSSTNTVTNTLSNIPSGSMLVLSIAQKDNGSTVFNSSQAVQPPTGNAINDGSPVILGMKFRASVDGYVTGFRFFKASNNTGTHTGELYNASGLRLGQAVYTNETASGWQQANLATPVFIQKGQTYVVTYHSSDGFFSTTNGYFTAPVLSPPLEALADGVDGPNSLYDYSPTPIFPTQTYAQSNYWVDVVFAQADAIISSTPALTWKKAADAGDGKMANAEVYTAYYPSGGNVSVTANWMKGTMSSALYAVSKTDSLLNGVSGTAFGQSQPSVSVTTSRSRSLLFAATSDLNAMSGTSRIYRDTATESYYHTLAGVYTAYHYRKPTNALAVYTEGLTAPTGMKASTALYELMGTATASTVPVSDAGFNQRVQLTVPPTGSSQQQFCGGGTIADLKVTGLNIRWYDSSRAGNLLSATQALVNGKRYYATQFFNGCESYQRLDVLAGVYPPPAPPVIEQTALCTGMVTLSTNATGSKLWSTGDTASTITVRQSGTYSLVINPGTNCSAIGYAQVTTPAVLYSASINQKTNVTCYGGNDGSLALQVSGGQSPYTYLWSNGSTSSINSGLRAGSYQVIVTDNTGCALILTDTIKQPALPVSVSVNGTNILKYGAATGSISASATGGVSPYMYSIDGFNYQNTGAFSFLTAGEYTIYVKDAVNCLQRNTITLTQPLSALKVQGTITADIKCFGDSTGSITATGSGGISPYQYKLNNGAFQSSNQFIKLSAGSYLLTISDSAGILDTSRINLTQPSSLPTFTVTKSDIQCANGIGSITVNAAGGTPMYTYSINGGANYQSSETFNNLSAGTYSLRIKDQNNCLSSLQSTTIANSTTSVSLSGSLSSGTINSYQWTLVSGPNTPLIQNPSSVNTNVTGLIKGSYVFRLSVNGGASSSLVRVNVDPTSLQSNAGSDRTIALPVNSVTLDGNGSTGNIVKFAWNLLAGPNTPVFSSTNGISPTVSGLTEGNYSFMLEVTDNNNTISRDTVLVTVSPQQVEGNRPVINNVNNKTSTSNTVTNSLTAVPKNALLVLTLAQGGDITATGGANAVVSSSPVLTWTKRADAGAIGSGNAEIYTAVFAAGGKISIKSTWGANAISATVYTITNNNTVLDGVSAAVNSQSSPTVSVPSTLSNSLLIGVTSDRSAKTGTTRRYLDTATESQYYFRSGVFGSYHYRKFTYAKGTYIEGLSAPTGMSAGTAFYEVKGLSYNVAPVIAHAGYNQNIACAVPNVITKSFPPHFENEQNIIRVLKIIPNPSNGRFDLSYTGITAGRAMVKIIDVNGHIVFTKELFLNESQGTLHFDLVSKARGIYFVQLIHPRGMLTGRAELR
jgi:glucose/arabinose dehydrogenase